MNPDEMVQIVPKNLSSGVIDNSGQILSGFWERSMDASNRRKENGVEKALEIFDTSKEALFICTPRIAAGNLLAALDTKQKNGVRIYLLVRELDIHYSQKVFEHFGIVRECTDITSTLIISDPNGECRGIWFDGDLSSKNKSYPIILPLNHGQAYEAYCHFSHLWWKSEGDEIKDNRKFKTKPMHPKAPEYPSLISSAFRIEALDNLVPDVISEIGLVDNAPENATVFLDESNGLACVVNEKSREYIEETDASTITGYESLPFSFIISDEKALAFSGDFGFILDERQKLDLLNYTSNPEWNYHCEKETGLIQGKILPFDSNWDLKTMLSIEPQEQVQLNDVVAKSIDDWIKGDCRPKYPDALHYAKSIEYTWRLLPPVLPGNANKHTLYGQWNEFETRLKKSSQDISSEIKKYEKSLEGIQKITKKNLISEWTDSLASLASIEWTKDTDIQKAKNALKTLEKINNAIFQESEEIQKNTEKDGEINEYSESSGKKKEVKKKTVLKKVNLGTIAIPKHALPKTGILYRVGNDDYLAIKRVDEIETAKEETLKYTNCRLVAEKTW